MPEEQGPDNSGQYIVIGFVKIRLLDAQERAQLPPESLKHYLQGLEYCDKIFYSEAIESFKKAHQACPECLPLSFFLAEVAKERARADYGDAELKLYKLAASALQNVLKQPKATMDDKDHAQRMLQEVNDEIKKLENPSSKAELEAKRVQIGLKIIEDKLRVRFPDMFKQEEEKPVLGGAAAAPGAPGALPPLRPLTTIAPQPTPRPVEAVAPYI